MRWRACSLGFLLVMACVQGPVRVRQAPRDTIREPSLGAFRPGTADPARKARLQALGPSLDALFQAKLAESGATGMAVGIVMEGELVYARGFGVQDILSETPVDEDSIFRIASMTKSFTALSVLKLRDEGKVSLEDAAAKYFPELAALAPPTRDSPPVTLRLLLTNASGLAYDDLWGTITFGRSEQELLTLLRAGVQIPTTPGTRYAYSNLGWALLGQVVKRVSNVGYREFVAMNVLEPLAMKSTAWEATDVPSSRLAIGYHRLGSQLIAEPRVSDGVFDAASGIYTSLRDYARYLSFQLSAYPPRDDPEAGPVRRSTLREMHEGQRYIRNDKNSPLVRTSGDGVTLRVASYGFGWISTTSCNDEGRVQHSGFEPGYFSTVVMVPRARIGLVVLSTSGPAAGNSREGALDILREAALLTSPELKPHAVLAAAKTWLPVLLASWDPDLAARTFDPDSLRYSWNQRLDERFASLSREHGRCHPEGELKVHSSLHADLRLACERGAMTFDLLLSPAIPPRIQHVEITEELPPDEHMDRMARVLASGIGGPEDAINPDVIERRVDLALLRRTLQSAGKSYHHCEIERGSKEVTYGQLGVDRTARYRLRCGKTAVELTFSLDDETGRITSFAAHPPRATDALCWQ